MTVSMKKMSQHARTVRHSFPKTNDGLFLLHWLQSPILSVRARDSPFLTASVYHDKKYVEGSEEPLDGSELSQVACTQTKPVRSGKMDSNSKHCPSRSSTDNLTKQPTCTEDKKDSAALPTSCGTSSTAEDRTQTSGSEASNNRQPPTPCGMKDMVSPSTESSVVAIKAKEDCVTITSQTVERPSGASSQRPLELSSASCVPAVCVSGEVCANERLSGADAPSPQLASYGADPKSSKDDSSAHFAQGLTEVTPQGTKRSHEEVEKEDEESSIPVKQKNKKRCFKCSCKLELAQREIGRCRCDRVFCSLHRLPESHGCEFDHKEDGRREAREKMVKPTRHLGTSFRRLDHSS